VKALAIYAGPRALAHLTRFGLQPDHVRTMAGAAGGPKGLILGPLDRFVFGQWLPSSGQPVDLVGASIGAWRMATACLNNPVAAFERLEHDYIHQHYALEPGQRKPTPDFVSRRFGDSLQAFYGGRIAEVLAHPRYRVHIVTSRGRHLLSRENVLATPLGYLGAFLTNAVNRKAMSHWLERVVFSAPQTAASGQTQSTDGVITPLPFLDNDYRTRQVLLTAANFMPALQASCSIPFVLRSVQHIAGAPPGAYWDGGITDYHLHLNYAGKFAMDLEAENSAAEGEKTVNPLQGLVLYPHFQQSVVPGWLDKSLKSRHKSTHFLDTTVLLAPRPQWVQSLPNGKLPDRQDFTRYGNDLVARVKVWQQAVAMGQQLADEFAQWLSKPDFSLVQPL
jgi:hypothetical protein